MEEKMRVEDLASVSGRKSVALHVYPVANGMIFAVLALFSLLRLHIALRTGRYIALTAALCAAALLCAAFLHFFRNKMTDRAFLCPLIVYALYNFFAYIDRDNTYFFIAYFISCCLSAVYCNWQRLGQYLLVSTLLNGILIYFRLPLQTPDGPAPYGEILVHAVGTTFACILLYYIAFLYDLRGMVAIKT
jgi:hypothetical protein